MGNAIWDQPRISVLKGDPLYQRERAESQWQQREFVALDLRGQEVIAIVMQQPALHRTVVLVLEQMVCGDVFLGL
jgi:hypothetical protein